MDATPEENAQVICTGDLCPANLTKSKHHLHMFRAKELRQLLEDGGLKVLLMTASDCLCGPSDSHLEEARQDPARWQELLMMELEACREPGCLDMGTHLIAVAKREV